MHGGGGGRRRILSKDYTLLRDDQDPDDIEVASKKSGASAWRLIALAKEQALVSTSPLLTKRLDLATVNTPWHWHS